MESNHSGSYEWVITNFLTLKSKQASKAFKIGVSSWRLTCFPEQNTAPHKYVSVYLELADAMTPSSPNPKVSFKFIVRNHRDPSKDVTRDALHTFVSDQKDWGFSQVMPAADVNTESGYLREDGALVVRVEMEVEIPREELAAGLSRDLLSLLEAPGPTSDLTLRAGDRSFPVHRAILAARCPYFNTLFGSDFADSGARELPLPDTDPDALAALLRCMYGGVLACPRELLKAAAELAERLLLPEVREALHVQIVASCTAQTVVEDLLWAEARGAAELEAKLGEVYVRCAAEMDAATVTALARDHPDLMARLHLRCMQQKK